MTAPERRRAGSLSLGVVVTAAVTVALVALPFATTSVLVSLLTAGLLGTAVALGALIVIAGCVLTGAVWWIPIRGLAAAVARLLPVPLVVLGVTVLLGREQLYPWATESVMQASEILQAKAPWLSEPFFLLRGLVVLLVWWALGRWVRDALTRAMASGEKAARRRLVRACVAFVLLLAPTLSVASWDWAMSLEPTWFSTMYGVYLFAGFFLAGLAALAALASAPGGLPGLPDPGEAVRHDLGKLVFAFAAFWAYIWYCQYMLIWYANLPEEVTYFTLRLSPEWSTLFWLVPVLSFVVPFVILMPAATKKHPATLFQVSLVVLVGRGLDLYVMVAPPIGAGTGTSLLALVLGLALLAGMLLWLRRSLPLQAADERRGRAPVGAPVAGAPGAS